MPFFFCLFVLHHLFLIYHLSLFFFIFHCVIPGTDSVEGSISQSFHSLTLRYLIVFLCSKYGFFLSFLMIVALSLHNFRLLYFTVCLCSSPCHYQIILTPHNINRSLLLIYCDLFFNIFMPCFKIDGFWPFYHVDFHVFIKQG